MPDLARSLENVYESGGQEFESLRVRHLLNSPARHCVPLATQPEYSSRAVDD